VRRANWTRGRKEFRRTVGVVLGVLKGKSIKTDRKTSRLDRLGELGTWAGARQVKRGSSIGQQGIHGSPQKPEEKKRDQKKKAEN